MLLHKLLYGIFLMPTIRQSSAGKSLWFRANADGLWQAVDPDLSG
jgi:hypothetical protein